MAYVVRKGKLEFRPNTGNGPCNRRQVGTAKRRILVDGKAGAYHATKGWRVKTLADKTEAERHEIRVRGWAYR